LELELAAVGSSVGPAGLAVILAPVSGLVVAGSSVGLAAVLAASTAFAPDADNSVDLADSTAVPARLASVLVAALAAVVVDSYAAADTEAAALVNTADTESETDTGNSEAVLDTESADSADTA
jgi:hypothetical protein